MTREQLDELKTKIRTLKTIDKRYEKIKTAIDAIGNNFTLSKLKSLIETVKEIISGESESGSE